MKLQRFAVLLAGVCIVGEVSAWIGGASGQKLIGHGWDLLRTDPEEILANASYFDESGLDGVTVCLSGRMLSGDRYSFTTLMNDSPWSRDMFGTRVDTLREFKKHPGLRESFLMFWLVPQKRIAWDNDAAWARIAGNLRVLAWLGKAAGMKGYFIDCEDYQKCRQFFFDPVHDKVSYDEAYAMARRRGREVFAGLFDEHPDATVLSFWFFTLNELYGQARDPAASARRGNDLWPAFLNGFLDAMPPQAKFVDGNEWAYYNCDAERDEFHAKAFFEWHTPLGLVAPENRRRYKAQLSVGFGFYIDMFVNPEGNACYYPPAEDGSRLTRFERNLEQAARLSSEYVWIYGEKLCWVPWKKTQTSRLWQDNIIGKVLAKESGPRTWEDALPGLRDMFDSIRDPERFCARKLAELRASGIKNMIDSSSRVPCDVSVWQNPEKRAGFFGRDGETLLARGVESGCASVHVPVRAGSSYFVSVAVKGSGIANVHWKVGGLDRWDLGILSLEQEPNSADDGWRTLSAVVRPPIGVEGMVLSAWASQQDPMEVSRFRDFTSVKLR